MSTDADKDSYNGKYFLLLYTEAFKRLGIPFLLDNLPLKRQGIEAEAGRIDGEAARAHGYGETHPTVVRVDEPVLELHLALYTANPTLRLQRIEELSSNSLLVEYRRGILLCENLLKPLVPADRLSDIATYQQGITKLVVRRTDVYCDFSLAIEMGLRTPELKGVTGVRKVLDIGKSIQTYPYLNKRHITLVPRLEATLRQMKAEGLLDTYRRQVERELNWGQ